MGSTEVRPLVAIFNTSADVINLLQSILEYAGFTTVVAGYISEFREGQKDVAAFFQEHQPKAVVYDIALPYLLNWQFFQERVLGLNILPAQSFVLTTTNKTVLEMLIGPSDAIELVGKPFDLDEIVQAVRRVVEQCKPVEEK